MKIYIVKGENGDCPSDHNYWDVKAFQSHLQSLHHRDNCNYSSQWIYLNADQIDSSANLIKSQYDPKMKHLDGAARYYVAELELELDEGE